MTTAPQSTRPVQVRCPHCYLLTNHIQAYSVPVVMFAFVYIAWSWHGQRIFGCPPCARKQLGSHALLSILLANVLCWIPIPCILIHLTTSYSDTRPSIPAEYDYLAHLLPEDKGAKTREAAARRMRLFVVLAILVVVIGVIVFVLPSLAN